MKHNPANSTEQGEPHKRLLATQKTWSEVEIMPFPSGTDSANPLCPHILSRGNTVVTGPNGNIYIISLHDCTCGSEKAELYRFSLDDHSLVPIQTSGERISAPYVYGSGWTGGVDGRIVLMTGSDSDTGDDVCVHSLDLKTKQWTRVTINGPAPCKRSWFTAVLVGSKFFIYGGWDSGRGFDDLFALDLSQTVPTWQRIDPSTSMRPEIRGGHICVHNATHLIIFGGWDEDSSRLDCTWAFDLGGRKWEEIQCSGPVPLARCLHAGVLVEDIIYMFGGQAHSDFWVLDLSKLQWHMLSTGGSGLGIRASHSMIYWGGRLYVFGGGKSTGSMDQRNTFHIFDTGLMPRADLRNKRQMKKDDDVTSPQYDIDISQSPSSSSLALASLLHFLRAKLNDPVSSMANKESMDLMHKLLRANDCFTLISQLDIPSDIEALIEFALYLLQSGLLLYPDVPDANRKTRRLVRNLIIKWPFIPRSMLLSGIEVLSDQNVQWEGFGDVVKGDLQGKTVGLKLLPTTPSKNFYQELLKWRSVHHKNVLSILGICEENTRRRVRYLVTPAMENGTLCSWRRERMPVVEEIRKLIIQVAEGIQYLHSEGIVHGDIRGSNVCLDSTLNVKIVGFTMPFQTEDVPEKIKSPKFAAPELFYKWDDDGLSGSESEVRVTVRTERSDVYAFGRLYYEIHFDTVPFNDIPYDTLVTKVTKYHEHPAKLETPAIGKAEWNLIRRCWRPDPRRRPTMEDIVDEMVDLDVD